MSDWLKQLAKLAPTAATLLGGPFAGMAVAAIGDALGISEPTQAKIENAFKSGQLNGDQLVAVKLAEQQLTLKLEELGVKREEIAALDRDSAREMQKSTRSKMPATLTLIVTIGFFGTLAALFAMPELKESAPLMIMLGQLSAAWAACIAFYVGTTAGSKDKTELLAQSPPSK